MNSTNLKNAALVVKYALFLVLIAGVYVREDYALTFLGIIAMSVVFILDVVILNKEKRLKK